ncbi:potassium channel family protein [Vallitalea okinawensis]|uniref:potassium channel family protein n=1 Tax=Vallitalea okinawensis TaxID=2078660 RepID=UPI000CFC2681|nr:TrkA family potassium uptake protein [Vallitalea okinawensis]
MAKVKKKEFVVFGLGKFGKSIAVTLANYGHNVLAIDKNEDIVQEVSQFVTHAVQADVTDVDTLQSLGIGNFDVAVVAISQDMQSSIMTTLLVKELGVGYVLTKAQNEIHKKVLQKIGADRVVFPEREMGNRIATSLTSDNIMDFIELSSEYSIVEIVALNEWIGKNLLEIDMRATYGINVMAIRRGEDINITPGANEKLREGDVLVVIGAQKDLQKISNQATKR